MTSTADQAAAPVDSSAAVVPTERIQSRIFLIRREKVMLDSDLAELYGVTTKALNQAVRRNLERFPADFMFQLTDAEMDGLSRSQFVTPSAKKDANALKSSDILRSQFVTSKRIGGGGRRYLPYAFTEQGVAMLSSVLRSQQAVQVNIAIMRAFVRLRQLIASSAELARKLNALEKKYDEQFKVVFDAIRELMSPIEEPAKRHREMGFHTGIPALRRTRKRGGKKTAA